jgi:hypothetical protein
MYSRACFYSYLLSTKFSTICTAAPEDAYNIEYQQLLVHLYY